MFSTKKILLISLIVTLFFSQCNGQQKLNGTKPQKTFLVLQDTGFVFPNGQLEHNYVCFVPSNKESFEKELLMNDTLNCFDVYTGNCDLSGKFDPLLLLDTALRKKVYLKSIEGDSLYYYKVIISIKLNYHQLQLNQNNSVAGLEDIITFHGKRKILKRVLKEGSGYCSSIRFLKPGPTPVLNK